MKAFLVTIALFAFATTASVEECTQGIKDAVDDLFNLTLDIEEHGLGLDAQSIKDILTGTSEVMNQCAGMDVNLNNYDKCVDGVMPAMPMIKKLVDDIKSGQTSNIMMDITQIGLQVANGVTTCMQQPKMQELDF